MTKTLTDPELEELRVLIDAIDNRLDTSNYQMLARAKIGSRLSPTNSFQLILDAEMSHIRRIREMLGLPARNEGPRSHSPEPAQGIGDEPLREQLVKKGIEPDSYRNVRLAQEKRNRSKPA